MSEPKRDAAWTENVCGLLAVQVAVDLSLVLGKANTVDLFVAIARALDEGHLDEFVRFDRERAAGMAAVAKRQSARNGGLS